MVQKQQCYGLYLAALGVGGIKGSLSAHGAEHVKVVMEKLAAKCNGNIMGNRNNNNLNGNIFW